MAGKVDRPFPPPCSPSIPAACCTWPKKKGYLPVSASRDAVEIAVENSWLVRIDGVLDNAFSVANRGGASLDEADALRVLRRRVRTQASHWPQSIDGFESWAAPGLNSRIHLQADEWQRICGLLLAYSSRNASLGGQEDQTISDIVARIRAALST